MHLAVQLNLEPLCRNLSFRMEIPSLKLMNPGAMQMLRTNLNQAMQLPSTKLPNRSIAMSPMHPVEASEQTLRINLSQWNRLPLIKLKHPTAT